MEFENKVIDMHMLCYQQIGIYNNNNLIYIYYLFLLIDMAATGYNCSYQLTIFTSFDMTRDPGTMVR